MRVAVRAGATALAAVAVTFFATHAHAAPATLHEITDEAVPGEIKALAVTPSGSAFVAGKWAKGSQLAELDTDGRLRWSSDRTINRLAIDPSGQTLFATGEYSGLCVSLADHRTRTLDPPSRALDLVAIDPDHAAFLPSGHDTMHSSFHDAIERGTCGAKGYDFGRKIVRHARVGFPIADGAGGFYALVTNEDDYDAKTKSHGYVHIAPKGDVLALDGPTFPLFKEGDMPRPLLLEEGVGVHWPQFIEHAEHPPITLVAPDGAGGFYGQGIGNRIVHVHADGAVSRIAPDVSKKLGAGDDRLGFAWDPGSKSAVILRRDRGVIGDVWRVVFFDEARVIEERDVPLPSWVDASGRVIAIGAGGGAIWIATAKGVLRGRGNDWLALSNRAARLDNDGPRTMDRDTIGGVALTTGMFLLGAAPSVTGTGAIASGFHGEQLSRTVTEGSLGTIASVLPVALIDLAMPYVGDGQIVGAFSGAFAIIGIGGACLFGSTSTWATGELVFSGSRGPSYLGALGGACAGAAVDAVLAYAFGKWMGSNAPGFVNIGALGFTSGLVGGGATIGYHWAGKGP